MKMIGIIGGIGPESTIEYYRLMIDRYRQMKPDGSYPSFIVNSINLTHEMALINAGQFDQLAQFLAEEVQRLARAGAEIALLAANTPHIVFDQIQRQSPIPLLSIVQATCDAAREMGLKKLGLLGTRFTMQATFYPEVFSKSGMTIVTPGDQDQSWIHHVYFNELVNGIFLPATRERLLAIAGQMQQRDGIEGLILGGTELPLAIRTESIHGIPVLDTGRIHVNAVLTRAMS